MEHSEKKLGTTWISELKQITDHAFDLDANQRAFLEGSDQLEALAEPVISQLINDGIAGGIQSCLTRGSNSLGIKLPAEIIGTKSFLRLREWLESERLEYAIPNFVNEQGKILAHLSIQPITNSI